MASDKSFDKTIADGDQVTRVWEANSTLTLGDITLPGHKADVAELVSLRKHIKDLKTELTDLVNLGNARAKTIRKTVTRARSGARAIFGPDSSQYEQLGGTRESERKPTKRKNAAKTSTP